MKQKVRIYFPHDEMQMINVYNKWFGSFMHEPIIITSLGSFSGKALLIQSRMICSICFPVTPGVNLDIKSSNSSHEVVTRTKKIFVLAYLYIFFSSFRSHFRYACRRKETINFLVYCYVSLKRIQQQINNILS